MLKDAIVVSSIKNIRFAGIIVNEIVIFVCRHIICGIDDKVHLAHGICLTESCIGSVLDGRDDKLCRLTSGQVDIAVICCLRIDKLIRGISRLHVALLIERIT